MFTKLSAILLLAGLSFSAEARPQPRDWTRDAVRLTGESDFVRGIAIQNLRRRPQIGKLLLHELQGPQKALALDVITALKLRALLPRLLQEAKADESGQIYLTVDALVAEDTLPLVKKTYMERLFCEGPCRPPEPARLVMLESLSRMDAELPAESLKKLFAQSSYEVRSAILRYVKHRLQQANPNERSLLNERYSPLIFTALESQPYQIRLQALYLMRELNLGGRGLAANYVCSRDSRPEIRDYCRSLARGAK